MGFWNCEKDSDRTLFNNIGDKVPQSIADECKKELRMRGYTDKEIQDAEWYGTTPSGLR